jgi:predicted ferric reductase
MTHQRSDAAFEIEEEAPVMSFPAFLLLLLAAAGGAAAAVWILPGWLPALNDSLNGSAPQVFWFLSRSSAFVAYTLLWLSMVLGLLISNKLARLWPGGPQAFDLHQYTTLLGLAFALFHGLILIGDQYIHFSLTTVLTPFTSAEYRPVWVGLGQVGFYLMGIISLSFYVRRQISSHVWRLVHYLSFVTYLLALTHGIMSGTDSTAPLVHGVYWATGGLVLFLFVYRLLGSVLKLKPVSVRR